MRSDWGDHPLLLPDLYKVVERRMRRHLRAGNTAKAVTACRRYTRVRPRDSDGWMLLSIALDAAKEPDEEERILREGLEKNPHAKELKVTLAWILAARQKHVEAPSYEEATALLQSAIQDDPSYPGPYLGLMRMAARESRWADVEMHGEAARRRISRTEDPESFWSLIDGLLYVPGQVRCRLLLEEVTESAPEWPYPLLYLAALSTNDDAATALAGHARRLWPNGHAETFEAALEEVRGKVAGAREWLEEEHPGTTPLDDSGS